MKKQEEKSEIDFVITWVDGNDPAWKRQRNLAAQAAEQIQKTENPVKSRFLEFTGFSHVSQ